MDLDLGFEHQIDFLEKIPKGMVMAWDLVLMILARYDAIFAISGHFTCNSVNFENLLYNLNYKPERCKFLLFLPHT